MATEYTITYFDINGWAEPARIILSYAGAKWTDNRIPFIGPGKSPIPDDIRARLRFGQVPLLEFDGKRLVQSVAICRYLAREFNLAGKDSFESAQCDEMVDAMKDGIQIFMPHFREQDPDKRREGMLEGAKTVKERFLSRFNDIIQANGGHLVGNSLSWADIMLITQLEMYENLCKTKLTTDLPAIQAMREKVTNLPGIKQWIAKRPEDYSF